MRKCLAAFTPVGLSPPFVSINTNDDQTLVEISVRGEPKDGAVYGPQASITMPRAEFALLLVKALANFQGAF